ncbi:MAG: NrdH-redoxin [Elusimicrobia bacterium RIFOXYD2_FULL_34_15]|nr:MAG: NrdH-redoxin [Elusimicrobia bacterium RIFOXYD2_FULL_34_15]
MKIKHIEGEKNGNIMMYTLSTCVWCKKIKKYLKDLGVEYHYIDVDLLEGAEKEEVMQQMKEYTSEVSYPMLVINEKEYIIGYKPDEIKEKLGL